MSVKEYFDSNANPVENGYVFVLLTEKSKDVYENYIKKAADYLEFRCESFLDLRGGGDALNDILKRIQKAEILIYDITGFPPNVMWELGVGLTIKDPDKVIVIHEASDTPVPFNIYSHRVIYQYDRNDQEDLNRLRDTLVDVMRAINRANIRDNPIKTPDVRKLVESTIKAVESKNWILAEVLIESVDRTEPENWYVFNLWGIMLRSKREFESAINKFNQAIQYATFEDEKAYIYTELAILFQLSSQYEEAEDWFRKAEKADSTNKHLYIAWAEFYDELHDHFMAQAKTLSVLGKLKETDPDFKEIKLRHDYYNVKIDHPTYEKTFDEFKLEHAPRFNEEQRDHVRIRAKEYFDPNANPEDWKRLSNGTRRSFKLSVFYPKLLSKRFDTRFVVSIFFPETREEMMREVKLERDIEESGFKGYKEYTSNTKFTRSNKVVVELQSHYVDFTPVKVAIELQDNVNTIRFLGTPKDTCQPGTHHVIISISDQATGRQYQSESVEVRVVDFAFDHISRPLISRIVSSGLALGSLVTFLLTLFGKIDNTFGLASGTVGAALGAIVYSRFILLFQKPHQSSIGES